MGSIAINIMKCYSKKYN